MSNAVSPRTLIKAYEDALKGLLDTASKVWTEGSSDALSKQFIAIKAHAIEMVATGHVKALEAVGRTPETLKDILDLNTPIQAKDEIVHAMMAHFSIGDELYRVVEANEVSPSTMLALHLQLTAEDPHDDEVTTRLRGIPDQCFIDAFVATFTLRANSDLETAEFLKTVECLKHYINQSKTLASDIELIAAHLEQLRPGLEMVLALHNVTDDSLGYRARVVTVVSMTAEFWVGLYETTQDSLIKQLAAVAFKRPEGPRPWQTFERMGFVRTPKWHAEHQSRSVGLTLMRLYEHAILTPGIEIVPRPDEQFKNGVFKSYIKMLEQVPLGKDAMRKAQKVVDMLVEYCRNNHDSRFRIALENSAIEPRLFARHHQILGSRFAADLGL
jgi:hypothetical protein